MAILKQSALEVFVKSYVKQNKKAKVPAVYINKAIALISERLDSSCCTSSNPVNIYTFRDNQLTRTIKMYLTALPKKGNVKSFERAIDVLTGFKNGCC